jgi:hypothetical protein
MPNTPATPTADPAGGPPLADVIPIRSKEDQALSDLLDLIMSRPGASRPVACPACRSRELWCHPWCKDNAPCGCGFDLCGECGTRAARGETRSAYPMMVPGKVRA